MKKIAFILILFVGFSAFSQSDIPVQNISTDDSVTYRLFSTRNMYTFIKLDTSTGKMWQVQWGTETGYTYQTILSDINLSFEEDPQNGRFFLYPTSNIYTFILLDQIDGSAWQVQWSQEEEDRALLSIYEL